jgi:ribosomal-protein-alanine N-acetyltransferase
METNQLQLRLRTSETMKNFLLLDKNAKRIFIGNDDEDILKKEIERVENGNYECKIWAVHYWDIILKIENVVIGNLGFHSWRPDHRRAELGLWIWDEKNRNQGYTKEALKKILPYGFNELKLQRIEACTAYDNEASIGILKKFGFVKEGVLRKHYQVDGINEDSVLFSLIEEDLIL